MENVSYENITIEECLSIYNKDIACICDADNKIICFKEEK